MILGELSFINKNAEIIIRNATTIYNQKINNKNIPYIKSCVNYLLLEEKCKEYMGNK